MPRQSQNARIGIAESDPYPRIAITGTIGYESRDVSTLFQGNSFMGDIGPGFQWDILNYGPLFNNVQAEEARLQKLVLNFTKKNCWLTGNDYRRGSSRCPLHPWSEARCIIQYFAFANFKL